MATSLPDQRSTTDQRAGRDESYPIVEISTGDTLAPQRRRRGLGTEPMTCPPNASQSGELVIHLEPGESATATRGLAGTPMA